MRQATIQTGWVRTVPGTLASRFMVLAFLVVLAASTVRAATYQKNDSSTSPIEIPTPGRRTTTWEVTVVEAGRTFKILSQNDLGESLAASPAISNGTIYLRTFDALWAIRAK